ncbi:MAG: PriCT-2 domain-containing protein [Stellaceae bacterium]
MSADTIAAARDYRRCGRRVVLIPAGQKGPREKGWQDRDIGLDEIPQRFAGGGNVGVILGARSGELTDIDLDCPEALALADIYLPPTDATFGRKSKPRSHRLYIAPGARYESFADPLAGKDEKSTLLEIRADGPDGGAHLTLFPPSVADGERREWHDETIAPAVIDAAALRTATAWLTIGCLTMRHVSEHAARRPGPDLPRLLWECDHALGRAAYRWLGWPDPEKPRWQPRRRAEMSRQDIDLAEMVAAIPNDADWEEWNAIGLAIHAASGGSDDGFIAFDDFSERSPKYLPHAVEERWRNYRRSPPSRTGIGKLVKLALAAGWRPKPEPGDAAQ